MWICAGRVRAGRRRRAGTSSATSSARASSSRATRAAPCKRSTTSAGIAARGSAREAEGEFAGSIQCPYHAWTYDLDGRLIGAPHMDEVPHFSKSDYPLHRVHADVWDGHVFVNLSRDTPPPLAEQLADLPAQFPSWRMAGSPARAPDRLRREGELEADRPELQRVPALPQPAPGAQQAVALSERRERAAPADLHGWTDGPASRRGDAVDGRHVPAAGPAGAVSRRMRGASTTTRSFPNMLLSLHPDYMMVHTLWPVAPGPHDQRLRVALPPDGAGARRLQRGRRRGLLGRDEPAGLARVRAVAGRASRRGRTRLGPYSNREDLLYAFDRMIAALHGEQAADVRPFMLASAPSCASGRRTASSRRSR